jgi:hypothetical protein
MSELQAQAKAILPSFINGKRFITQISEPEAIVVARWTLKTAVVLSHAIALEQPLPTEHLNFLRNNPTGVVSQVGVFATVVTPARDFSFGTRGSDTLQTVIEDFITNFITTVPKSDYLGLRKCLGNR